MRFTVPGRGDIDLTPDAAVIAGFTGRDADAVQRHVDELAAAGVPVPPRVPSFYALPASLLTQGDTITVTEAATSGEVEIVLLFSPLGTFVTLGSDHTDRTAETKDIGAAKRSCPKVLAREAWPYESVEAHWDLLQATSWIVADHGRVLYQEGRASSLLQPHELLPQIPFADEPSTLAVFCGTFDALGGIRPATAFAAELFDPVLEQRISFSYRIEHLRILSDDLDVVGAAAAAEPDGG